MTTKTIDVTNASIQGTFTGTITYDDAGGGQPPGGGGSPAVDLSQTPFTPDSLWNQKIPSGKKYTSLNWPASTGWNYNATWDHASPGVFISSSSDPVVQVTGESGWGWPDNPSLKVPAGVTGGGPGAGEQSDMPLLVIDDEGMVWNFWRFHRTSETTATCDAYAKAHFTDDTGWGDPDAVPGGLGAGICAAAASQLGGLLVQAQTDAGDIKHAMALALDDQLLKPGYVPPAIGGDGRNPNGSVMEGELLGIPPSTSMPGDLSPLGQKLFKCFKEYGCYVIDNGTDQTALRAQMNAYDKPTMDALRLDLNKIIPMLKMVK